MISRVIAEATCIHITHISVETKWIGNVMEQDIIYVFKKSFLELEIARREDGYQMIRSYLHGDNSCTTSSISV